MKRLLKLYKFLITNIKTIQIFNFTESEKGNVINESKLILEKIKNYFNHNSTDNIDNLIEETLIFLKKFNIK